MAGTKRELLIVGNWKMNPPTIGNARRLFLDIRERLGKRPTAVNVAVAPPTPYISELVKLSPTKRIAVGAQDVFYEKEGARTGEVSLSMLKSVGAGFVIIGHSERRALGETDEVVAKKLTHVLKQKVRAILCVGEEKRDRAGNHFSVVETQLTAALRDVKKPQVGYLTIAYEPVWAIGTGKNATPADAEEMRLFIQKIVADRFGRAAADKVRVLYGGSVNRKNAEELLRDGNVDGFLIGGASLRASEFVEIIHTARVYVRGLRNKTS